MTKWTLESPAIAVLLHAGLFAFVATTLWLSERHAEQVEAVAAPAPAAAAPAPDTLLTLRAQADRFGSASFSGSLTLLPTLYDLSAGTALPHESAP